jgi:hypothetical protein
MPHVGKYRYISMCYRNYFPSHRGRSAPAFAPAIPLFNQNMAGNNSGALLLTKARFTIVARPSWQRSVNRRSENYSCAGRLGRRRARQFGLNDPGRAKPGTGRACPEPGRSQNLALIGHTPREGATYGDSLFYTMTAGLTPETGTFDAPTPHSASGSGLPAAFGTAPTSSQIWNRRWRRHGVGWGVFVEGSRPHPLRLAHNMRVRLAQARLRKPLNRPVSC